MEEIPPQEKSPTADRQETHKKRIMYKRIADLVE
jgi:hypothetical protein